MFPAPAGWEASHRNEGYLEDMLDLDPALSREEYHAWVNGLINGAYLQRGSLPPTVALTEAGVNAVYHLDTDEARWAVVERFLEQRGRSTMVQPVHDPSKHPGVASVDGVDLVTRSNRYVGVHASAWFTDAELFGFMTHAEIDGCFSYGWAGGWRKLGHLAPSCWDGIACETLAYWTGRDPERMDRLFRQSGLYRTKWDEPRGSVTYGEEVIASAIWSTREVWNPLKTPIHVSRDTQVWELRSGDGVKFPEAHRVAAITNGDENDDSSCEPVEAA